MSFCKKCDAYKSPMESMHDGLCADCELERICEGYEVMQKALSEITQFKGYFPERTFDTIQGIAKEALSKVK